VTEENLIAFIRTHVTSVGALELLLLLRRERDRDRDAADLVRELRSSPAVVADALGALKKAGLVRESADGRHRYAPSTAELEAAAAGVQELYAVKPLAVVKAIVTAPNEKLRIFSDAFKFKGST
jgi:hypothetical protein